MNELALFAGAGGGILAGKLHGWRTIAAVEINPYRARRLMQRQNEGHLPPFPIWDDVRSFDGRSWRGLVDLVSAGFPCTDISRAGRKEGIEGEASGLWVEVPRILREIQPRFAFLENAAELPHRGLGRVLGDLAELGFDARWCVLGSDYIGAEQPNLQAPVEGVTYDYAPLIGLKPLARLNGKVVSEGLLRRCEQMLQFYFEYLCDELAEEGDIAMAAEARDELRALLDEGKEGDGHV